MHSFQKPHSTRYQLGLLAALAIGLIATITTQASAQTLVVNSGILDGIDGVVVDGTNYNVMFVAGSCVSLFNGCTSSSDFTFGASGASDAASALASILSGGIVNPVFANGIVDEFDFGQADAFVYLLTPYLYDTGLAYFSAPEIFVGGSIYPSGLFATDYGDTFGSGNGMVYDVFTPTSVPEPGTLFLFGAGLLGLGALRHRRIGKVARS